MSKNYTNYSKKPYVPETNKVVEEKSNNIVKPEEIKNEEVDITAEPEKNEEPILKIMHTNSLVNLREEPCASSKILSCIKAGDEVTVRVNYGVEDDRFVRVTYHGVGGYCMKEFLE